MEVTPGRRPRDLGQGVTPMAKRAMERVITAEEDTTTLSIEQMSNILMSVKRQYESDMTWFSGLAAAVEDHANRLDYHRMTYKKMKEAINDNDKELKQTVEHN